jgi:hypothetical protein
MTPLEKRLLDMGPIREDGSDKFYGMENVSSLPYYRIAVLLCAQFNLLTFRPILVWKYMVSHLAYKIESP